MKGQWLAIAVSNQFQRANRRLIPYMLNVKAHTGFIT